MFRRTRQTPDSTTKMVCIRFGEREIVAAEGDTVAAALLAAGVKDFRSAVVSGQPRAPFCMIGNCFDCLLEIDGEPNRQSCRELVREGMQVNRQRGLRTAELGNET